MRSLTFFQTRQRTLQRTYLLAVLLVPFGGLIQFADTAPSPLIGRENNEAESTLACCDKPQQDAPAKPLNDRRSLKEAVGDRFKIGVGVGHQVLKQPEDAALIRQHFQSD